MEGETSLMDILDALDLDLDASGMVHIAHWVTPSWSPVATIPTSSPPPSHRGTPRAADPREMTEAAWLAPAAALRRFERGDLPMVFPTVRTLEELAGVPFHRRRASTASADRTVTRILPRLVRTETGVAIVVDDDVLNPNPDRSCDPPRSAS